MSVGSYIVRRFGGLLLVLLVTSFLVFGLLYLAPGSPLAYILGPRGGSPAQVAAAIREYHLNDPFILRYVTWISDVLHGNLGYSIVYRMPVSELISARVGTTAGLVAMSAVIIAVIGVVFGTIAALRSGWADQLISSLAAVGLSAPVFVIGVALISLFAVALGWFPTFGVGSGGVDTLWHLTLPAITLSVASAAYLVRITKAAVNEEQGREHVQTATVRGLASGVIVRRHVLRNALIPITTVLGLTIATLIAGAVVVENVFALDGLGSLLVKAILQRDFAVVQAVVLVLVVAFVVINAIVDVLYTFIDPRISLGSKK
jgi:peptide/nickel transport system permease protein